MDPQYNENSLSLVIWIQTALKLENKQMTVFNNYRFWESYDTVQKQHLLDWMDKENVEYFWIYRISLLWPTLPQTKTKKKPSYECKLFAVAKFLKWGICEIHLTETQLTSGSTFTPGNVIGTGYSSSSASESTSAFILTTWCTSQEDAGHISLHGPCTFSKSARFCKKNQCSFCVVFVWWDVLTLWTPSRTIELNAWNADWDTCSWTQKNFSTSADYFQMTTDVHSVRTCLYHLLTSSKSPQLW
jgi:hypothetical protein